MDYITSANDYLLKLESSFDEKTVMPWMTQNWHYSLYVSVLYLALVFAGQKVMQNRKPFNLRVPLCMWSTALCVFSCFAVMRIFGSSVYMVRVGGLRHAFCDTRSYVGSNGCGLWAFLFPLSKLPELFDTAFIVLRKSKISFLHCYHHITVFIYCWYSYGYPISTGIWFGVVNYTVHGIMYGYYGIKASGRNPPRWVATAITLIQLSQMFVGLYINYISITSLLTGRTCQTSWLDVALSIFFYSSYAILFGNFFYWTYISSKKRHRSLPVPPASKTGFSSSVNVKPTIEGVTAANGSISGISSSPYSSSNTAAHSLVPNGISCATTLKHRH